MSFADKILNALSYNTLKYLANEFKAIPKKNNKKEFINAIKKTERWRLMKNPYVVGIVVSLIMLFVGFLFGNYTDISNKDVVQYNRSSFDSLKIEQFEANEQLLLTGRLQKLFHYFPKGFLVYSFYKSGKPMIIEHPGEMLVSSEGFRVIYTDEWRVKGKFNLKQPSVGLQFNTTVVDAAINMDGEYVFTDLKIMYKNEILAILVVDVHKPIIAFGFTPSSNLKYQ